MERSSLKRSSGRDPQLLWFGALAGVVSLVSDGWSGKPSPLLHQLVLLPAAAVFFLLLRRLLNRAQTDGPAFVGAKSRAWGPVVGLLGLFEAWALLMMEAEQRHFARFGYHWSVGAVVGTAVPVLLLWWWAERSRAAEAGFAAILATYLGGLLVAVRDFPLNYLRSDMLPVITWADARLLHGLNPYATMHVGTRLYDFPYLPGMLVAFLPTEAAGLDPRWATMLYSAGVGYLVYVTSRAERRLPVLFLLGLFFLCPFLQYRHDLYLQPHWFAVTAAVVLMQTGRQRWSAVLWGCSCAIYQLSWVVLPFYVLFRYRRDGMKGVGSALAFAALGAMVIAGPFLPFAAHQVASNTVGQWSHMPHALADPINLSFWLTYAIRPDQLRWLQAVLLGALFVFCFWKGRCGFVADTLRWMVCALAVFIPLNVLVDGYFYLTLLLLVLLFVCSSSGFWKGEPGEMAGPMDNDNGAVAAA